MPAGVAEREAETRLHTLLRHLFPNLGYPNIATGYESGNGPIDVYCRNVVFETKAQGKMQDVRVKPDGSTETPEEQALRYLDALTSRPRMFDDPAIGWRACVTDGKEWNFYDYDREADQEAKLTPIRKLLLSAPDDDDVLVVDGLVAGMDLHPVAVELSKTTKMLAVSDPPFPQANSSVVFGSRPRVVRRNTKPKALSGVWAVSNDEPVDTKMAWEEVKPRLQTLLDFFRDGCRASDRHFML